mmetsp:Transcript_7166/g.8593  ORF Transcript_7166/g.8593 Transcript_7166/m.8593 type:complete len:82 (-) Transcript_7166:141-386(-)
MYYGSQMMRDAGVEIQGLSKNESSLFLYVVLSLINMIGSVFSMLCIDRLGRRFIILRSVPLTAVAWLVTAAGMGYKSTCEE